MRLSAKGGLIWSPVAGRAPVCFPPQGKLAESDQGYCRRYAPRPDFITRIPGEGDDWQPAAYWPQVSAHDWCGEYQAAASTAEEATVARGTG